MNNLLHRKVLILAANPTNSSKLRIGEEVREIDEGLKRARHRDQYELISKWAVRSRDFYRHILDVQPNIVHFSGHGTGEDGIVLEDEDGKTHLASTNALKTLFKLFGDKGLECVLLNACFSKVQAEAINQHIPYVIGMSKGIGDKAAISFAVAFYDALGAGETVEFAFNLACVAIQMASNTENPVPVLKKNLSLGHQPSICNSPANETLLRITYRVKELDAHTMIKLDSQEEHYTEGCKFKIQLENLSSSKIIVDTFRLVLKSYKHLPENFYLKLNLDKMKFGQARTPHQLFLNLKKDKWNGYWVISHKNGLEKRRIPENIDNLLDVEPPMVFDIGPGDVEIIHGAIKAIENGLYEFVFSGDYRSIGSSNRTFNTQTVFLIQSF
jgi:hypothetical protein